MLGLFCLSVHQVHACFCGSQQRVSDPLELELEQVGRFWESDLGPLDLGPLEVASAVNH